MPRKSDFNPNVESADKLAELFSDFDFGVATDDFLIYEISRLIDDDRANFEDEEFRRVIDEGIREHVEERIDNRADMATVLRTAYPTLDESSQRIARRTVRALEDAAFPLQNVSLVVRVYTAFMFRRLQDAADQNPAPEEESRLLIERWHKGEILREEMTKGLKETGRAAVGPLADLLFEAPEDRMAAEMAIDTLGAIYCSSSARALVYSLVEPLLEEDLELKAALYVRQLWPLPRHYILYNLAPHTHEDIPFRWYQILIACDELSSVDMVLDELVVHGEDPSYHEDLWAILDLLRGSHDPDLEEKIVALLNAGDTPAQARKMLEEFVATLRTVPQPADNPWSRATRTFDLNRSYLAAAKLYEAGKSNEALTRLRAILKTDPEYPFAKALCRLLTDSTTC